MRIFTNLLREHWRLFLFAIITLVLFATFNDAILEIWIRWGEERYSHAPIVFLLAIYLAWIKRHELNAENTHAWYGVGIVIFFGLVLIVGELSAIWTIVQYALVLLLFGFAVTILGAQIRKVIIPFLHILVVIPLPYMLDVMLSGKFQLMSSDLGVSIIRLLGMSVFQEGNIIDLGLYKLQVVEACSGLNYTYPLMTIGLMMGYMYKAPFFARFMLFASTIPISIVMNSFRIAVVALFVNHSGIKAAEGFMHYFEGWVIFIICICTLLIEVKIFNRLLGKRESLADSFDYLEAKSTTPSAQIAKVRINKMPIVVAFACILVTTLSTLTIHHRDEVIPPRATFDTYPLQIEDWVGRRHEFQNGENEMLKLKDYFLADYNRANTNVGVYLGYTESQRRGFVPHSPKACIPGGGWEISDTKLHRVDIDANKHFEVTRMVIAKGESKQLIYYWFHQRGRDLSNEFPMKFALLYDAIQLNRTDGAIVRFTTTIYKSEEDADRVLTEFIRLNYPKFQEFIPN
ncbi:MAG: VPLPA-CTERM-specific exosortase XrtD [Methylophilales bacterium 28-44-11]|nr:MAG: VPLPA-CTERM-specific exosortase XrtD [Methylophilales bacterium 28-44-11]